jgi:GDP-4-dehydro-6-deoxy-D-mannose reductase
MRVLVTGALGFAGRYTVAALRRHFASRAEVFPTSRSGGNDPVVGAVVRLDVTDASGVEGAISAIRPTHVIHLAGLSVIAAAAADEDLAWRVHLSGTLNVARAITRAVPDCTLVHVGSGQVYGRTAQTGTPLDEQAVLSPTNAQMASKGAADLALIALAEHGLKCMVLRPFNHTGPGQSETSVLPSFALQIARIRAGLREPVMSVGNLAVERDFLDVRDVAAAYVRAVEASAEIDAGTIINIASGVPRSIQSLLEALIRLGEVSVVVKADESRIRPGDLKRFVGDATRARRLLGWTPRYPFEATLRDMLEDADRRVRSGQAG